MTGIKNYNEKTIRPGEPGYVERPLWKSGSCLAEGDLTDGTAYLCTRRKGHKGPHSACGFGDVQYATWEDDDVVDT